MLRRATIGLATVVITFAVSVGVAFGAYQRYQAANYYFPITESDAYLHHLTGNQVDNGSCEGNRTHCGTMLCAYAENSNYQSYGSRLCGNDTVYHGYGRQNLHGFFDEYSNSGAYIYGTVFY